MAENFIERIRSFQDQNETEDDLPFELAFEDIEGENDGTINCHCGGECHNCCGCKCGCFGECSTCRYNYRDDDEDEEE